MDPHALFDESPIRAAERRLETALEGRGDLAAVWGTSAERRRTSPAPGHHEVGFWGW